MKRKATKSMASKRRKREKNWNILNSGLNEGQKQDERLQAIHNAEKARSIQHRLQDLKKRRRMKEQ